MKYSDDILAGNEAFFSSEIGHTVEIVKINLLSLDFRNGTYLLYFIYIPHLRWIARFLTPGYVFLQPQEMVKPNKCLMIRPHLIMGGVANFRFLVWQKSYQGIILGPIRWPIYSVTNFGPLFSIYYLAIIPCNWTASTWARYQVFVLIIHFM